jgi:hypothetical protein
VEGEAIMEAIVTVKISKGRQNQKESDAIYGKPEKKTGTCPLSSSPNQFGKITCTDVEGQHHSYIEYGTSIENIKEKAELEYGHVTRIETTRDTFCPKFEELYHASMYDVYKDVIDQFFHGMRFFNDKVPPWKGPDGPISKGFIWTAEHEGFETLTVEPKDGGQYEIAVRMPHVGDDSFYSHSGYAINDYGTLQGYGTSGH